MHGYFLNTFDLLSIHLKGQSNSIAYLLCFDINYVFEKKLNFPLAIKIPFNDIFHIFGYSHPFLPTCPFSGWTLLFNCVYFVPLFSPLSNFFCVMLLPFLDYFPFKLFLKNDLTLFWDRWNEWKESKWKESRVIK